MRNNVKISNWRKIGSSRSRSFNFEAPSGNQFDSGVGFNVTEMDVLGDGTWLQNSVSVHLNHNAGFEFDPEVSIFRDKAPSKEDFVVLRLVNNVKIFLSPEQLDKLQAVVNSPIEEQE
jgi:hypothetical protein